MSTEGETAPDTDVFGTGQEVVDDGLDDEERERLRLVEEEQAVRVRELGEKQSIETGEKDERRSAATTALNEYYQKRDTQTEQKKSENKEQEWAFLQLREEHKKSKNPWEKIIDNCEMNKTKYSGSSDVTRLRQAMLARKGDIKRLAEEDKTKE